MVPAAFQAALDLDAGETSYYLELINAAFNEAARRALRAIMPFPENYQYTFPPLREAQKRGETKEAAAVVLRVLAPGALLYPMRSGIKSQTARTWTNCMGGWIAH